MRRESCAGQRAQTHLVGGRKDVGLNCLRDEERPVAEVLCVLKVALEKHDSLGDISLVPAEGTPGVKGAHLEEAAHQVRLALLAALLPGERKQPQRVGRLRDVTVVRPGSESNGQGMAEDGSARSEGPSTCILEAGLEKGTHRLMPTFLAFSFMTRSIAATFSLPPNLAS